ncbi:Na+/H+ antiporter NhaA [Xenorhabdus nematophila]|uniref:Na+/H+ antiporter NhaA n=1 Tax=Xenorhabdus nematophila TaxID=628 RepID=UPI000543D114|nr:Na+/H+ antiporter NhaA [Xenorhabdus nematophila]CEF28744.1 sodium:proton antiporter (NhaA family) [Xenorhabdus nematophila str. Websteri]AYA42329.1 Na+/H+ antiporter NhaA [Xenorhabdus nematophila]MBA0021058.1 Na+/H+ antiporter NhaA [Xenorhabdus nematophila]MCB4424850.1 Na+/H+ antiporter NhaA [Xenorhabdus nematophila]QNJ36699.1 Na+/H+ antiporter NhaA [Xenorhabdus nematophila]
MTAIIRQFLKLEAAGGILLIVAAIIALIMANTPLQGVYHQFLNLPVAVQFAALDINKPLLLWINDGLMAVFFLIVGLEVKRELMEGSLAGRDKAVFPAIAALGGMLAPALVYLLFNSSNDIARQGWAIPAATDIAFALGVMALLGKRVPTALKVFLLALAIIDDLGVIVIIALFYTKSVSFGALGFAAAMITLLAWMNWKGIAKTSAYLAVGVVLWVCILKSGVHATLTGVIVGFLIPLRDKKGDSRSEVLEHELHPWVAYLILPLFAFANAGVALQGVTLEGLTNMLPVGIALGLFIGKPLGIFLFSWIGVKLGIAQLPEKIGMKQIFAVSVLCGIGFTMSIFISALAFEGLDDAFSTYARLGILIGSTIAAIVGYSLLNILLPKKKT